MLTPFQFAIITVEEAQELMGYIERSTNTPAFSKNYKKMEKEGVLEIYNKLRNFVEESTQYNGNLRYLNPDDYVRERDLDGSHY